MKQKIMRKVILSLIPIIIFSVYLYGLRVLILLTVISLAGVISEYVMLRLIDKSKVRISEAVFVTSILYTLTLPPTIPIRIALIGIVFGVVLGKCVFGGFGRNFANPALVARCFIYISFPAYMTVSWSEPFKAFPGGLLKYRTDYDMLSSATPLSNKTDIIELLSGFVSGSLGESAVLLIFFAAVYLILTKTASWTIMLASIVSFTAIGVILYYTGVVETDPIYSLLTGGFLFAAVFMATDPVSAPTVNTSKVIYGILIGCLSYTMRYFSLFIEGVTFAILTANVFAPLIDLKIREIKSSGRGLST